MKTVLVLLSLCLFTCNDEKLDPNRLALLDHVAEGTYTDTDALAAELPGINGVWRVTGTGGGFTGAGYEQDFDYLLLKPNQVYGIVRDDQLIDFGQVEVDALSSSHSESPRLTFLSKMNNAEPVQMTGGTNYAFLNDDGTLTIGFAAADGFDTYFERE